MGTTSRGYRYPESTDHTRLWEHIENLADDIDADVKVPLSGFGQRKQANATSALSLSTTLTDVPGCSVSVTVAGANAYVICHAAVQFNCISANSGHYAQCSLVVDGTAQASQGTIKSDMNAAPTDGHRSYVWEVGLTAGTHTIKLQGSKDNAGGNAFISNTLGTNLVVQVFDLP
jgi:hypothetical protein